MKIRRRVSRRSFLAQVAGGAALLGGLTGFAPRARAQVTDSDPSDPVGRGRGGGTGITDSDPSDPGGRGRGTGAPRTGTGITDSDPSDPVGGGRGNRPGVQANPRAYTGVTDSDSGAYADPVGGGRGSGPMQNQQQQRCAADRSRAQAIQQQIGQHPYWTDAQIDRAGETYNYMTGEVARQRNDTENEVPGVESAIHIRNFDEAMAAHGVGWNASYDAALAELRQRIDQALALRGQRQAMERELYGLQQRLASCP